MKIPAPTRCSYPFNGLKNIKRPNGVEVFSGDVCYHLRKRERSINGRSPYFHRWRWTASSGVTGPRWFLPGTRVVSPLDTDGAHTSSFGLGHTNSSTVYIIRTTGLHLAITDLGSSFFLLYLCCLSQRPQASPTWLVHFVPATSSVQAEAPPEIESYLQTLQTCELPC